MRWLFPWLLLPTLAAADEGALAALAGGRAREGVERLRAAARGTKDADLLCLLGRAERLIGDERAAAATLERVPPDASCAPRAGFTRADALLALGRADEAAALYDALGARALGPDRDAESATAIAAIAGRLLADPEADRGRAVDLLALAVGLQITPERRLELARRLAKLLSDEGLHAPAAAAQAQSALLEAGAGQPADRRLLARVLSPPWGLAALASLLADPGAEDLRTAARVADAWDADVASAFRDALLARFPDAAADEAERHATALADSGRLGAARPLLERLAAGTGDVAARAAFRIASMLLAAERLDEATRALAVYLQRFPAGEARAEAEAALDAARLRLARRAFAAADFAVALAHYDTLVTRDPRATEASDAAFEAGLAARAAGDRAGARRRWEAVRARWPGTDAAERALTAVARSIAFDDGRLEEAVAWLRAREKEGAPATERERMRAPDVRLSVSGRRAPGRTPSVHVVARNLDELEVRRHRIDAEAYLLAGGTPAGLPALDVRVIAPDERWKAAVPGFAPAREIAFDLPVPVPSPGFYVVTVAAPDREASAVMLVSDLDLVARAVGPDLAVAVFRAGRPVAGAAVVARAGGEVRRGRTDDSGLFRAEVPGGPIGILATHDGAPALLELTRDEAAAPHPALRVGVDLDRPVWRPGDLVGFRIAARRGGAPPPGPWRVTLGNDAVVFDSARLEPGPEGSVRGELRLPPVGLGPYSLSLQIPGEDAPMLVTEVALAAAAPPGRDLVLRLEGEGAVAIVREADGRPAADVPVAWLDHVVRTDASGRADIPGPPAGLPWRVEARIAGTPVIASASRTLPELEPLALHVPENRLRPGEAPRVRVEGASGPVRLTLARVLPPVGAPPAPSDPWVPEVETALKGPVSWSGHGQEVAHAALEEELVRVDLDLKQPLEHAFAAVPAGRYRARVVALNGRATTVTAELEVAADGVRLTGARDVRAAESLSLRAEGAPALVTAEGDRLHAAAVVPADRAVQWRVPVAWGGALTLAATAPDGRVHPRVITVDASLQVALQVREAGPGWAVEARVTDGAGRPVQAEVVLSALDERLLSAAGDPATLDAQVFETTTLPVGPAGGATPDLAHGAEATAVAASLLAESAREEEARRAEKARSGHLGANAVADALRSEVPLSDESIGLGMSAHGSGAGGLGLRGSHAPSIRAGRAEVRPPWITGERARVLWWVGRSGPDGVARATVVPVPSRPSRWRVSARALTADAMGAGEATADSSARLRLVLDEPGPGAPGEQAHLRATVVNGRGQGWKGGIAVGAERRPLDVPPGEARTLDFGPRSPGAVEDVVLLEGDQRVAAQRWTFRLAEGEPSVAGPVLNVAVGPGGEPPLAAMALGIVDPYADAGRAAAAGRAALAALPRARAADRAALLDRVSQSRAALRLLERPGDVPAAAETLLFLAEVRGVLEVPRGEMDAAREAVQAALPGAQSAEERVAAVHALAAAGAEVDDALLNRLRSATLADESASRLARALVALKRRDEARSLVRGAGPHAVLARAALGDKPAVAPATPPPVVARADWIAALALTTPRRSARGVANVRLSGVTVGEIDLASGGVVRLAATGDLTVEGATPVVWRSDPRPAGEGKRRAGRLPSGASGQPVASDGSVPCDPCRLRPGDAIALDAIRPAGWTPPGGLSGEGVVLRATVPGRYIVAGLLSRDEDHPHIAPLVVEAVESDPSAVAPDARVALAAEVGAAGLDPGADDESTPPGPRATLARLRFEHAARTAPPPAEIVSRFEGLRELAPDARLELPAVLAVARAYNAVGRPERAVAVWRAGLGAAFVGEAAAARELESRVGLLASVQALRAMTGRYPVVAVVEETQFHLPERLGALADADLPPEVVRAGITTTDLRLMAAAWDREFLALHPDSPLAPQAGFHLVQGLLRLRAFEAAAEWAARVAAAHPQSEVLDGLLLAQGLARAERGATDRALALFERVATTEFPQGDGTMGPAASRVDARYAAARIHEARGDRERARAAYEAIADEVPEAAEAAAALRTVRLTADAVLRQALDEPARVPVRVANLDEVDVRVYRLDLRTLFLRDAGLAGVLHLQVSGVSPAWAGRREIEAGAFPRLARLDLPLEAPGAWLVRVVGGGRSAGTLLVRSDLELSVEGGRVRAHWRRGAPAAGVALRAVSPDGSVVAGTTDLRGVAHVPPGSAVLAFEGEQYAFTDPGADTEVPDAAPAPASDLLEKLDERLRQQRSRNQERYEEQLQTDPDSGVEASEL